MENPLENDETSCPQDEVREPEQGKSLQSNTKTSAWYITVKKTLGDIFIAEEKKKVFYQTVKSCITKQQNKVARMQIHSHL